MVLLGVAVASGGLHGQGEPAGTQLRALLGELRIDAPPTRFSAPSFTLPDPSGKAVGLGDFRGRVVMLYFWTTY
jgi:cytochrome oxidase Cu insertion factor (SCO1/SenC/PrrC family)